MNAIDQASREQLEQMAKAPTIEQALAQISVTRGGRNGANLRKKLDELNIPHTKWKSRKKVFKPEEILVKNSPLKRNSTLKYLLFEWGLKEKKCEECGNIIWRGQPIALQAHHIDGDKKNNEITNIQILCGNCHDLTPNHSIRKDFRK
jgi:5-methylcytosine-specific restriction endonuclease McrA